MFPGTAQLEKRTREYNRKLQSCTSDALRVLGEIYRTEQQNSQSTRARIPASTECLMQYLRCELDQEGVAGLLRALYAVHPPLNPQHQVGSVQDDCLKKTLKMALLHYHPDRQSAGCEWFRSACAEISKVLTEENSKQNLNTCM
jgi:hypothetical protein